MSKTIKFILWLLFWLLLFSPALFFYFRGCYTCIWLFIFPVVLIPIWIFVIYNSIYNLIFLIENPESNKNISKHNNIHRVIKILVFIILLWIWDSYLWIGNDLLLLLQWFWIYGIFDILTTTLLPLFFLLFIINLIFKKK